MHILCSFCKTLLLRNPYLWWDTGKVRDTCHGVCRLSSKGSVNNVIILVITEMNCSCNYMQAELDINTYQPAK